MSEVESNPDLHDSISVVHEALQSVKNRPPCRKWKSDDLPLGSPRVSDLTKRCSSYNDIERIEQNFPTIEKRAEPSLAHGSSSGESITKAIKLECQQQLNTQLLKAVEACNLLEVKSTSKMFTRNRTDGFHAVLNNKVASLVRRVRASNNSILKMVAEDLHGPVYRYFSRAMTAVENHSGGGRSIDLSTRLLDAGANPNATVEEEVTSVCHIAAASDENILSLLLERGAKKHRTNYHGYTLLHLAAWGGNFINLGLLLGLRQELQNKLVRERAVSKEIEKELINLRPYLKNLLNIQSDGTKTDSEIPKHWLCYGRNETDSEIPKHRLCYGRDENNRFKFYCVSGWTPLHAASFWAHEPTVRFLLAAGANPCVRDHYSKTPLTIAGQGLECERLSEVQTALIVKAFPKVVKILLSRESTKTEEKSDLKSLLILAMELKNFDIITELLKAGTNENVVEMDCSIDNSAEDLNSYPETINELSQSLDNMSVPLYPLDSNKYNRELRLKAFKWAVRKNKRDVIRFLICRGTDTSDLQMIIDNINKPTEFLEEIFDSYIMSSDNFWDPFGKPYTRKYANINYIILKPSPDKETTMEMKIIKALINTGNQHDQKRLLIHPLVESFICLKWRAIIPFFYTMLAFFGLFTISLTCYILSEYYYNDKNTDVPTWLNKTALIVAVYVSITLTVALEILFYLNQFKHYLLSIELWIKFVSLVLGTILPIIFKTSSAETNWSRHLASTALLLSWMEITLMMSRFPKWGFYVLMFEKVAIEVLKILLTFSSLLIGFSLCFMIQFHSKNQFDNPWAALIKTMVMMTSEYDYNGLVENNNSDDLNNSLIMIRLMFLMFLFLAGIVLMNLMVGVAVDDINSLKMSGNIKKLENQVEFLSSVETNQVLMKILKKLKFKLTLKLHVTISQPPRYSYYNRAIPSHVREAIFNITYSNNIKEEKIKQMKEDLKLQGKERAIST